MSKPGKEDMSKALFSSSTISNRLPLAFSVCKAVLAERSRLVSWLSEQSRLCSAARYPMPRRSWMPMPDTSRPVTPAISLSLSRPSLSVSAFSAMYPRKTASGKVVSLIAMPGTGACTAFRWKYSPKGRLADFILFEGKDVPLQGAALDSFHPGAFEAGQGGDIELPILVDKHFPVVAVRLDRD